MKAKSSPKPPRPSERSDWDFSMIAPPNIRVVAKDLGPLAENLSDWLVIALRLAESGRHKQLLMALLNEIQCALLSIRDVMEHGRVKCTYSRNDDVVRELRSVLASPVFEEFEELEAKLLLGAALRAAASQDAVIEWQQLNGRA